MALSNQQTTTTGREQQDTGNEARKGTSRSQYLHSDVVRAIREVQSAGHTSVGPVVRVVDGGVRVHEADHVCAAHCGAHCPSEAVDTALLVLEPVPVGCSCWRIE